MNEILEAKARPDTGALCLVTLCQFHQKAADPEQILREYSPDGGRMDEIALLRAAKGLDLKAKSARVKMDQLEKQPLPAMAQNNDGDWFILAKIADEKILVQHPGASPLVISQDEFAHFWNGTLIFITSRAMIAGAAGAFDISWFIPAIVRYKKLFGEVLLASFFLQLFGLVTPLFFQVVVDKVLVHQGLTTLDVLVIGLVAITFFDIILGGLRSFIFAHTTSRVDVELGARLFRHLLALPLSYFNARPTGQTVARVRELENIRDFLTSSSVTVVLDLLFTVVFLAVMWFYSPTLTMIVLGAIPLYAALSLGITPALRRRIEEKFQRGAANQAFLVESVTGVETLKAMAVESGRRKIWEEQLAAYVKAGLRAVILGTIGSQGVQLISRLVTALILWMGAKMVIGGELSMGQLIAFNMLAGQVNGPVLRLAQLWQDFQQFRISVERLGDVLNHPTEPGHNPNRPSLPQIKGKIEFDHVNFRYSAEGRQILHDFTLGIDAGEVIGIVGRSGSGKSTLAKLLQRLHVPETGRVLVDGVDLAQIDPAWLRRQIGVVLQENMLFSASVKDNIALSMPSASMEAVTTAAKMAGAHDFILELTEGYDTQIEERGTNLSGGQRQRIAIARALITNPQILIFDEATSALDYESERIIQDNMNLICKGRTVIIIAHRLSTVRHANRIIVVEQGRLQEKGAHGVLIEMPDGIYANLWKAQTI